LQTGTSSTKQQAAPSSSGSFSPSTLAGAAHVPAATSAWGPRPGYAWVSAEGATLIKGPPAAPTLPDAPPPPLPATAALYASLSAGERSLRIWKRISPGMLPGTSATPVSTNQSTYASYPSELLEPVDMTHHLRKTDFSE
jgi:hypothetical protein